MENLVMDLGLAYKDKKVFVTGHTGFKGSWLITWLNLLGASVKGYALEPKQEYDLYNVINGDKLCNSILADIRDKEKIKEEIINFQPDFIFHMAAQSLVRLSYDFPVDSFEINALGTLNILDALRYLNKPCVSVFITTDKVYQNFEMGHYYKEDDRLGGYDPYSASKACAELIIESYRNSFFNNENYHGHQQSIASARAGNVIGGGDWAKDRIIPDLIRALQQNKEVVVRNPSSIRPWQYVLEPIGGYLLLGAKMNKRPIQYNGAWNFGPQKKDELTVKEIVENAIAEWGTGSYHAATLHQQPHEAELLHLDINKAMKQLEWRPKMNSLQAVHKTIDWYKKAIIQYPFELMIQQINEYQRLQ
jgi:CDP-glucose 4,6-dehydratase